MTRAERRVDTYRDRIMARLQAYAQLQGLHPDVMWKEFTNDLNAYEAAIIARHKEQNP